MHIAPRSKQATGSTLMATRWSSSEGPTAIRAEGLSFRANARNRRRPGRVVIPNEVRNRRRPGRGAPLPGRVRFLTSFGMTIALGTTVLVMACVSTVTRYYLPDAKNPRFDTEQAARMLDQYVRVQCPERLAAKKPESGAASLTILTDTGGAVTRAELASTSGDETLDGVFGTITAQLKVDSLR